MPVKTHVYIFRKKDNFKPSSKIQTLKTRNIINYFVSLDENMYFWKMRKKGKIKCIKKCIGRLGKQRIMEIDCLTESSYILEKNNDVVDIHTLFLSH